MTFRSRKGVKKREEKDESSYSFIRHWQEVDDGSDNLNVPNMPVCQVPSPLLSYCLYGLWSNDLSNSGFSSMLLKSSGIRIVDLGTKLCIHFASMEVVEQVGSSPSYVRLALCHGTTTDRISVTSFV